MRLFPAGRSGGRHEQGRPSQHVRLVGTVSGWPLQAIVHRHKGPHAKSEPDNCCPHLAGWAAKGAKNQGRAGPKTQKFRAENAESAEVKDRINRPSLRYGAAGMMNRMRQFCLLHYVACHSAFCTVHSALGCGSGAKVPRREILRRRFVARRAQLIEIAVERGNGQFFPGGGGRKECICEPDMGGFDAFQRGQHRAGVAELDALFNRAGWARAAPTGSGARVGGAAFGKQLPGPRSHRRNADDDELFGRQ